jgi:hypothetical protein
MYNDSPLGELFYRLILIGKRETKAADIEMDKRLKREWRLRKEV